MSNPVTSGPITLLNNVVAHGASEPPGTQAALVASQQHGGGLQTVLNRVEPADTKATLSQTSGGLERAGGGGGQVQQGYARVGPAAGVNQQGVPIVATDGSLVSAVKSGALNPYMSQLHQLFSEPSAGREGIFVAEGTHYLNTERNNDAEAYSLASVPPQREDLTTFQNAEPRNWLANSYPVQLEQLNSEVYHFDTQAFTNNFLANAPSTISEVVQSNSSGWNQGRYTGSSATPPMDYDSNRNADQFNTNRGDTSSSNTVSSWADRVNINTTKGGVGDVFRGAIVARTGYGLIQNPSAYGNQLISRGQNQIGFGGENNNNNADVEMEGEQDPYQGNAFGNDEPAQIPGESGEYEGPGFEAEEVGEPIEGLIEGEEVAEGIGAAVDVGEGIGFATAVGATGGAILIAAGVGLAAYGLYETAVGLGAPTISEDVDAAGNWFKNSINWFEP